MSSIYQPTIDLPRTDAEDPRIGSIIGRKVKEIQDARVILLGFPSDEGVRLNGGRPGASLAPDSIRQILYSLTPDAQNHDVFVDLLEHTIDLGNQTLEGVLETNQEQLGEMLAGILHRGAIPIILGGGHETTFGHFLGYVYAGQSVSILNIDAHPDVRPLINERGHSGSPFRQALLYLSGTCTGYTVVGLVPQSTAKAHLDFIHAHDGHYVWSHDLTGEWISRFFDEADQRHIASFDIDAVDQAFAPGVSAPAGIGLSKQQWLEAAFLAGRCTSVRSLDIVELNPHHDIDSKTARLAALTVWYMLKGLAVRMNS